MAPKKKKKAPTGNNRGFATTSIPKKKFAEDDPDSSPSKSPPTVDEDQKEEHSQKAAASGIGHQNDETKPNSIAPDSATSATELEERLEQQDLQNIVDKHAAKIQRDASRTVSKLQTDFRVLRSQAESLTVKSQLPDQLTATILDLAKHEVEQGMFASLDSSRRTSKTLSEEDAVVRLWTLQTVLRELNFSNERVDEALKFVLSHQQYLDHTSTSTLGLEEGLDWLILNLDDDELPMYEKSTGKVRPRAADESDTDTGDNSRTEDDSNNKSNTGNIDTATTTSTDITPNESDREGECEVSDLDSDLEPEQMVQAHVSTKARLFEIESSLVDSFSKKKGPSSQNPSARNRRDVSKLMQRLKLIESDTLFDKSQANHQWLQKRNQLLADAAERRKLNLGGIATRDRNPNVRNENKRELNDGADQTNEEGQESKESDSDDDQALGNLFASTSGNLGGTCSGTESNDSSTIVIRDFGDYKGASPRRILEEQCRSRYVTNNVTLPISLFASLTAHGRDSKVELKFTLVSNASFSCRYSLQISWSNRQEFKFPLRMSTIDNHSDARSCTFTMTTISTPDSRQSEAFISTVALFELIASSGKDDKVYLRLPQPYRELWYELADEMKQQSDSVNRQAVENLRSFVRSEMAREDSEDDSARDKVFRRNDKAGGENVSSNHTDRANGEYGPSSEHLKQIWSTKSTSQSYQRMLQQRKALPILQHQEEIISTIEQNQVTILCGDTGCGKSTQLPHFLLEKSLSEGSPCKVYCTEPRRISAITLAQRVSEELGEKKGDLGTSRSLVGYSIRLESHVSPSTRLVYATTGIVLRMLESPGNFQKEVTHIVIDEVHERSIETDFLLIILRSLIKSQPTLKVVLMSATVDATKFSSYFNGAPVLNVAGRTFPVQTKYLEDVIELTGFVVDENAEIELSEDNNDTVATPGAATPDSATSLQQYSAKTRAALSKYNEYQLNYDLIYQLIEKVSTDKSLQSFSKAILVFLPGFAEIRRLNDMLSSNRTSQDFVIHALHSSIASEDQQQAFQLPPKGKRKIVLATNIAETGITIPDITCVIDTGTHKEMRFDERRQISRLLETTISRANAKQRRGRAGRVQEGMCFHLFTKSRHDRSFNEQSTPEMLRLSLQDLAMRVKICKLGDIQSTLSEALDPPSTKNVQRAIASLIEVGALTTGEQLTPLGQQLAKLPLDPYLGKMVLFGARFACLDLVLTVAAILTSKSPFVSMVGAKKAAQLAKESFRREDSDLFTEYNAYEAWRRVCQAQATSVFQFCKKNFLSSQTLSNIEDLKSQLVLAVAEAGLIGLNHAERQEILRVQNSGRRLQRFVTFPGALNGMNENVELIKAVIAWSLYPKILCREGKGWRSISTNQSISMHPSSILRNANMAHVHYLSYYSILQSTGSRFYNANSLTPVSALAMVLLAGDASFHPTAQVVSIDGARLRFSLVDGWKTFVALKYLRRRLTEIVERTLKAPHKDLDDRLKQWWSTWTDIATYWMDRTAGPQR